MPDDPQSNELLPRECLEVSSLLIDVDLAESLKWLDAQLTRFDASWAAQSLVTQGWLTQFQARAVCDGRLSDLQIGNVRYPQLSCR